MDPTTPLFFQTTPVSQRLTRIPGAPVRPTIASLVAARKPVDPSSEESFQTVLHAHSKECNFKIGTDIKAFVDNLAGKSGIYMISKDNYYESSDVLMKIGKAKNLKHRLKQYFFCYPGGFYIYGIILTKDINVQEKNSSRHRIEQSIHSYLRYLNLNILQKHGRSGEWFLIQSNEISKIFLISLSIATEIGLAKETPYCYAFFPPILVTEYKSKQSQLKKTIMSDNDVKHFENTVNAKYRPQNINPLFKSEYQAVKQLARPYSRHARTLFDNHFDDNVEKNFENNFENN